MRILGLDIARRKPDAVEKSGVLSPVSNTGWQRFLGWIREPFGGAWQQDQGMRCEDSLANHAVYSCLTLIANDIGKLGIDLVQLADGIWKKTSNAAFSPVLRKPNRFQNHIQFIEYWILSKLSRGNTYILKERDNRNVVVALYVLDPQRVVPLVAPDGSVYYQLNFDPLSGVMETNVTVPASEIIHDRMNCLYHPLVGISPLYACALSAHQGQAIQRNSANFFTNRAMPSGMLTAPGAISDETAERLRDAWQNNYTGTNAGKIAVAGDDLKFESFTMTSSDAQLIEQLKWSAEVICSVFHVSPFMIGVGAVPSYDNVEALNQQYYSQCLQVHIESLEVCLDEGLALSADLGIELDLDGLLRMDKATQMKYLGEGTKNGILSPNEARSRVGLGPVPGGNVPYLQQQNFSLEALAKRDALPNPFVIDKPLTNPTPSASGPGATADPSQAPKKSLDGWRRNTCSHLEEELGLAA
jgi:HK97 family phage portal protein